jgi:hypothetical protein
MRPIIVREPGQSKYSILTGRLVDTSLIGDVKDTVLDEQIAKDGRFVDLGRNVTNIFGKTVSRIYYPAFKQDQIGRFVILNDLAVGVNRILKIKNDESLGVEVSLETLETAVKYYHMAAMAMISGKRGIYNGGIVSSRTQNSGRAVLLINGTLHPDEVAVPSEMMNRLGIADNEPIIVGRDPTIWHGSMEVLRAVRSQYQCIELHPLLFLQMGADCDGDQVYIYKIPETAECFLESIEQVGKFARANAVWPGWTSPNFVAGEKVSWDRVIEETEERCQIGTSIGPAEILAKTQRVANLCAALNKAGAEIECYDIAMGISRDKVIEYMLVQNATQLNTKVWLGPIGAASNKLKMLASHDSTLLASAMYVSERLQQLLLASKHVVGGDKKEAYSISDALDLLNRRGKFENKPLKDVLVTLAEMGIDTEKATPIISYLWVGYPAKRVIANLLKNKNSKTGSITRARQLQTIVAKMCLTGPAGVKTGINSILEILSTMGIHIRIEEFRTKFLEEVKGLGTICTSDFPVFSLCSASSPDQQIEMVDKVVNQGHKDPSGITRIATDNIRAAKQEEESVLT